MEFLINYQLRTVGRERADFLHQAVAVVGYVGGVVLLDDTYFEHMVMAGMVVAGFDVRWRAGRPAAAWWRSGAIRAAE